MFYTVTGPQKQLYLSLERPGHLKKSRKNWEHPGEILSLEIWDSRNRFFSKKYVLGTMFVILYEILNISFYIIFYEDEDRKNMKIGSIKSRKAWI